MLENLFSASLKNICRPAPATSIYKFYTLKSAEIIYLDEIEKSINSNNLSEMELIALLENNNQIAVCSKNENPQMLPADVSIFTMNQQDCLTKNCLLTTIPFKIDFSRFN